MAADLVIVDEAGRQYGPRQIFGFAILFADARSSQQAIDVTPLNGVPVLHAPRLGANEE
jgi:hypothetical protein